MLLLAWAGRTADCPKAIFDNCVLHAYDLGYHPQRSSDPRPSMACRVRYLNSTGFHLREIPGIQTLEWFTTGDPKFSYAGCDEGGAQPI
jgi:hypothetical protein